MRERKRKYPDVAITWNMDESKAVEEGLDLIDADQLIGNEDVVVICPNWVNPKKLDPKDGIVVGQNTFRTIIQYVKRKNPKRIVIASGSAEKTTEDIMKKVGYDQIINEEQVEFIDLNQEPFIEIQLDHDQPPTTKLNQLYDEMTVLISYTQLKQHQEATMSAAIKNIALSWPPAEVHGYPKKNLGIHHNLHNFIRAMAEKVPIDISVLSANPAMVGSGPSEGVAKHTGLVICGTDPVATDVVGARLLGFKPRAINYLQQCIDKGIGEGVVEKMVLYGLSLHDAEEKFSQAVYGESITLDK